MQLVTGGAGFIGSHLVDALVRMGKAIRVLDNLSDNALHDAARKHDRIRKFGRAVEFIEGDVRDPAVVAKAVSGVRRVFHLAHLTGTRSSLADASPCLDVNVNGTQTLLEAMAKEGVPGLVLCSHGHVYGEAGSEPSAEGDILAPTSPFGASMVAAEALAAAWHAGTRGAVSIVRPFTTYGPRMPPAAGVRKFLTALDEQRELSVLGRETTRDYVFASDVIRVLIEARRVQSPHRPVVFNVATGRATSTMELIREMEVVADARARIVMRPLQAGDPKHMRGSPTHTTNTLQITPRVRLAVGLEKTLAWLRRADGTRPSNA